MTSLNFRCASIDGHGDRDDIALERDKIWNNRKIEKDWRDTVSYDWAESPEKGEHIEIIVRRMIEKDTMHMCYNKNHIYFPELNDFGEDYTIHDAVSEVCIVLGLSDEDFNPFLRIEGFMVDIFLQ